MIKLSKCVVEHNCGWMRLNVPILQRHNTPFQWGDSSSFCFTPNESNLCYSFCFRHMWPNKRYAAANCLPTLGYKLILTEVMKWWVNHTILKYAHNLTAIDCKPVSLRLHGIDLPTTLVSTLSNCSREEIGCSSEQHVHAQKQTSGHSVMPFWIGQTGKVKRCPFLI